MDDAGVGVEQELVARAAAGEGTAFAELHARYRPVVAALVRSELRGGRSVEVDDIVQDVFTSAWLRLDTLRDQGRFRPWLLQIARRSVIDHVRRELRRPPLARDDDAALERASATGVSPVDHVVGTDLGAQVRSALGTLSPRDATVLTLSVQFGFGPAEIAEAIGVSAGTAKVVLHRARRRLRAQLAAAA